MAKWLTQEWLDEGKKLSETQPERPGATARMQYVVTGGPEGDVKYYWVLENGKLLESKSTNYGYDAQKGEFTDMIKAGIIDPTKVVRIALQDAASVAGLLITTECMIADKPEKKAPPMGGGDMGGMGGMGGMDF